MGASIFGRNTERLEIAATQTFVRLRGLSETRAGWFSLYSPRLLVCSRSVRCLRRAIADRTKRNRQKVSKPLA
ncbi:hypothetical protein [Nostoc sp.]|uniref:hypothetical protein n=1 Tax=Nostoc sp. TaxID=1180 RepID=UPI002FF7E68B